MNCEGMQLRTLFPDMRSLRRPTISYQRFKISHPQSYSMKVSFSILLPKVIVLGVRSPLTPRT